ncbi:uncharacterized protein LOC117644526 [Thrips palmi]|uniref:Uncharacterized protein LOC117644526 n=1 Tax=Thrips palmi TaxID=161013 RepID=A0A6P8ZM44_THRPL|nr:uncharacterized protein LOC117644526 [Thrips palmi]
MESAPVNGANGFRGRGGPRGSGGGRGGFRGRGAGGSPFRGRGGARGGPHQGQGRPFRGQSGPFRGGRASFRGGDKGQAPFRGGGRGRGASSTKIHPQVQFVEPYIRKGLDSQYNNFRCLFEITNLPTISIQDFNALRAFIVENTKVSVKRILYKLPSDTSRSVTAVCETETPKNISQVADKLHGLVFRDRHLLINRSFAYPGHLENCVRVFTQKPVATEVTEETLYSLFESCGNLQVIRLINCKPDAALEALITFGDSDSVLKALKLNPKVGKTKANVVSLGQLFATVSPIAAVDKVLKDFKTNYVDKQPNLAYVYFSDEESYSKALELNGTAYDGLHQVVIQPELSVFIADPNFRLKPEQLKAVFGSSKIVAHPIRNDVHVIKFRSKTDLDNALKASPVLINNNSYTVVDSVSKIPITEVKSNDEEEESDEEVDEEEAEDESGEEEEEDVDAEEEEGDSEEGDEDDEGEDEDDEEDEEEEESSEEEATPAPKAPSPKKGQQPPAKTAPKRKWNDKVQKGGKKQKA